MDQSYASRGDRKRPRFRAGAWCLGELRRRDLEVFPREGRPKTQWTQCRFGLVVCGCLEVDRLWMILIGSGLEEGGYRLVCWTFMDFCCFPFVKAWLAIVAMNHKKQSLCTRFAYCLVKSGKWTGWQWPVVPRQAWDDRLDQAGRVALAIDRLEI